MTTEHEDLYKVPVEMMDGKTTTLEEYKGKVLLIVNVASKCGFTPQYKQLEEMHREYKDRGFAVLGFPCNQFMRQEPGSNDEIKDFAESCYNVTFPLFAKLKVSGKEQAPIYKYLKEYVEKEPKIKFIPWNFTKILVDANGNVIKRFLPKASFSKIKNEVEELLPK